MICLKIILPIGRRQPRFSCSRRRLLAIFDPKARMRRKPCPSLRQRPYRGRNPSRPRGRRRKSGGSIRIFLNSHPGRRPRTRLPNSVPATIIRANERPISIDLLHRLRLPRRGSMTGLRSDRRPIIPTDFQRRAVPSPPRPSHLPHTVTGKKPARKRAFARHGGCRWITTRITWPSA